MLYTVLLQPFALLPWWLGVSGVLYGIAAGALGLLFITLAARLWRNGGERHAKQLFGFSILYLFLLFSLMIVDRVGQPG